MLVKKKRNNPNKILQFLELLLENLCGLRFLAVRKNL